MALATNTTPGSIVIAGDLTGTSSDIQLKPSGVTVFIAKHVIIGANVFVGPTRCTQLEQLEK